MLLPMRALVRRGLEGGSSCDVHTTDDQVSVRIEARLVTYPHMGASGVSTGVVACCRESMDG